MKYSLICKIAVVAIITCCSVSVSKGESDFKSALQYYDESSEDYDPTKAFRIFQNLSKQGNIKAHQYLGLAYLEGRGVECNTEKAIHHLKIFLPESNGFAEFILGEIYTDLKDKKTAYQYFCQARDKGSLLANTQIGKCLLFGTGVEQSVDSGLQILEEQVRAKNDPIAAFNIGYAIYEGIIPNRPFSDCEAWFRMSGEGGYTNGWLMLGVTYNSGGKGIPKNPNYALESYKKAAFLGSGEGAYRIYTTLASVSGSISRLTVEEELNRRQIKQMVLWVAIASELDGHRKASELANIIKSNDKMNEIYQITFIFGKAIADEIKSHNLNTLNFERQSAAHLIELPELPLPNDSK